MSLRFLRNFSLILAIIIISFALGFQTGYRKNLPFFVSFENKENPPSLSSLDFSLFWDVWEKINRLYIDKQALNPQKMFYGAIAGMVNSLGDPYTVFLSPKENKEAKDDLKGKLEGIGVQLGIKEKKIVVVAPLKGTPAEKAGIRPGDWILKVNGKETAGWTLPEAVSQIRGPKGSTVVLTILHQEATQAAEIKIVREEINVPSVEWEKLSWRKENNRWQLEKKECNECEKVIYLKLSRFGDQTLDEWNKAVEEISVQFRSSNSKNKGLVFDLRNNPGGYLSGAVFIASEFLKDGVIVIQEQTDKGRQNFSVNRKGKLTEVPMVVLINKGSASASEIVAGALKERKRAKLVGEATFGKGSIQEAIDLKEGAGLHVTTAKWLLPSGSWINGKGIEPDITVENNPNQPEIDSQLEKAVEVLTR